MFILDATGNAMAIGTDDAIRVPHPRGNFAQKRYFQEPLQHPDANTLYVSAPFQSDVGIWTFTLSRAMLNPSGAFDGIIVATIDLNDYRLLISSARYIPDQFSTIIYGEGQEIISEPVERLAPGRNLNTAGTFFSRHMATRQISSIMQGTTPTTKGQFLISARTVDPSELHMNHPMIVGVGREIDAPCWRLGVLCSKDACACWPCSLH